MEKFKLLLLAAIAFVASNVLTSCSGDEKDSPDPGNGGKCVISNVIWSDPSGTTETYSDFKFDKNGYITEYTGKNIYGNWQMKYKYNSSNIVIDDSEVGEMAIYQLKNGLVVYARDFWDDEFEYGYDNNNNLTSIKRIREDWFLNCTWENGNIVSYTVSNRNSPEDQYDTKTYTIEYNNYRNSLHILPVEIFDGYLDSDDGFMVDPLLCSKGYFGNMPKNLPAKIFSENTYNFEFSYAEFNSYGYPSTMTILDLNYSESDSYKFLWSE